ncbi:MAG: phytanoyl-CoA dioxygenase family protein [Actinomycetota bacterium]|nr:phytanoyl-CoA dioxygenase family protein [Actinomycetota bacterium]|tara:strand:+ start:20475 stop:21692 length:1218 start_codon:yes stop_codon:yes gene_type:complete
MFSVDVRSRLDSDVKQIELEAWIENQLPLLLEQNSAIAFEGAELLGCRPLGIRVSEKSFTLIPSNGHIKMNKGLDNAAVVVDMDEISFSDLVQDIQTPQSLATAKVIDLPLRDHFRFLKWWPVIRAIIDGRPVHKPGDIDFVEQDGSPLDLNRSFTLEDSNKDISWFLSQTGFLHLEGWWSQDLMHEIYTDIDNSIKKYQRGDGRSWWAKTKDGKDHCVRLQYFQEHSETVKKLLNDGKHKRIASLPGDGHTLEWNGSNQQNVIEALVKPIGIVEGISDLPWHKDCSLGRHSYDCSSITVGISVTGADDKSGQLAVVAGSHRANLQPNFIHPYLDLPVVALPTKTGDVTVHLSCTLHMSHPPIERERRVMYTSFSLPNKSEKVGVDRISKVREEAYMKVSQAPAK